MELAIAYSQYRLRRQIERDHSIYARRGLYCVIARSEIPRFAGKQSPGGTGFQPAYSNDRQDAGPTEDEIASSAFQRRRN